MSFGFVKPIKHGAFLFIASTVAVALINFLLTLSFGNDFAPPEAITGFSLIISFIVFCVGFSIISCKVKESRYIHVTLVAITLWVADGVFGVLVGIRTTEQLFTGYLMYMIIFPAFIGCVGGVFYDVVLKRKG